MLGLFGVLGLFRALLSYFDIMNVEKRQGVSCELAPPAIFVKANIAKGAGSLEPPF